mmetsp:Transcript_46106/g.128243  ORF Transcript_46106/g.128243 Transcript_46106/m.128243 type:complete len:225 (-) Transcript_46106:88-762(-)
MGVMIQRVALVAKVPVESTAEWGHTPALPAQMPLANRIAHVANFVELLRDGGLITGEVVVIQQMVVAARHECSSGRRAPGLRVGGVDQDRVLENGVDVRPADTKVRRVVEIVKPQVVDKHKDEVRRFGIFSTRSSECCLHRSDTCCPGVALAAPSPEDQHSTQEEGSRRSHHCGHPHAPHTTTTAEAEAALRDNAHGLQPHVNERGLLLLVLVLRRLLLDMQRL